MGPGPLAEVGQFRSVIHHLYCCAWLQAPGGEEEPDEVLSERISSPLEKKKKEEGFGVLFLERISSK